MVLGNVRYWPRLGCAMVLEKFQYEHWLYLLPCCAVSGTERGSSCYGCAMQCPVLTYAMLQPGRATAADSSGRSTRGVATPYVLCGVRY
eukprot:833485-Rhodomonas_salina.1